MLSQRWSWHLLFWAGYALFRLYIYYITVTYYRPIFLKYMLLSEVFFAAAVYLTLWLYRLLFEKRKFISYFLVGGLAWIIFLYGRTAFQFYYLKQEPGFQANSFADIILNNIALVIAYFLFITSGKYFKDGYIAQEFETERKQRQMEAEVTNLKAQIAPHFLFNTLNNLYGLAVERSEKLPALMLRLSDILRHSLYETQRALVPLPEEIGVLKSYVELEKVRLEDDLQLEFRNSISDNAPYQIVPLILIVFMENAFKHARFVQQQPVTIYIETYMEEDNFNLVLRNNYNTEKASSSQGIGLYNVKRRLEVLYPNGSHQLEVVQDDIFYTVHLQLLLAKTD